MTWNPNSFQTRWGILAFTLSAPYGNQSQGRIKEGATGAIALGHPLQGVPRDDIYLFLNKTFV